MNAPAVRVNTCSEEFIRRSRAFGIGSSVDAIQTITPSVTAHNTLLIQRSNLNIGLIETLGETDLAMITLRPHPRCGELRPWPNRSPSWKTDARMPTKQWQSWYAGSGTASNRTPR